MRAPPMLMGIVMPLRHHSLSARVSASMAPCPTSDPEIFIEGKHFVESVLDLPPVIEIARPLIAESGVADRVEVAPFDATRDELPAWYDAALVCGLLHRMAPDGAREILGRVSSGLAPGGVLVASDLFAHEDAPAMPALFGLQMLLTTTSGRTHAAADVAGWLRELGLVDVSTTPLPPPVSHTVVSALKRA